MPRPIQIDRKEALKAARQLFWRQGYSATSMSQLLDSMGMGSGSFYAAFGSKEQLFERVLDDYTGWSLHHLVRVRELHRGLDAIHAFLEDTLVELSDAERRKGCLLVNSALELDAVQPRLHRRVVNRLQRLEQAIGSCVDEAVADGSLRCDLQPDEAVGLLMTMLQGLRVESRMGLSRGHARQRVDTMIKLVSDTNHEGS